MSKPLDPISPADLKQLLDAPNPPRLLDVREPNEWVSELGHIEHSELIPLGTLAANVTKFSGEAREIVVVCKSGMRAGKGAELLAQHGYKTRVLTGGMMAWNAASLPIVKTP